MDTEYDQMIQRQEDQYGHGRSLRIALAICDLFETNHCRPDYEAYENRVHEVIDILQNS